MLTIDELKEKLAKNVRERNELVALAKYHGYKIEFKAHEIKNQNFGFICPQEYEYTLTLNCLVPGIDKASVPPPPRR